MLFNSFEFLLLFLPLCLVVARRLKGNALLGWICLASAVFYAFAGHVWFLVPMAVTTVLDFVVARAMAKTEDGRRRRALLLTSLVCNLSLLAYFKYSGLMVDTVNDAARLFGGGTLVSRAFHVILPAGISFYTFQTLSYVIDVYRKDAEPEPNFWAYLAFVAFFPHLVAGPLTRHDQLLAQLHRAAREGVAPRLADGFGLFAIGLAKKVLIADRIALWNDQLIGTVDHAGLITAWVAILGYAMQIYFDFSGYSDMAIGLGRLFGVELPQNFDRPYMSKDPSEFWRRWHITLSQWLRDYLYISLGGNRRGAFRTDLNLMITMALGGLWHGASWTFVAWGVFHGTLLVVHRQVRRTWDRIPLVLARTLTFVLVCLGWVFFRAKSVVHAGAWFAGLFGLHGVGAGFSNFVIKTAILVAIAGGIVVFAPKAATFAFSSLRPRGWATLGAATALAIVMMNYSSRFLYFQF